MAFKLNVGASRKVTDNNYGSRGASINLEMEVDTSLVGAPAKLQERIRQVFGVVRVSLAEELNGGSGHGNRNGNGHAPYQIGSSDLPNGHSARTDGDGTMSGNGNGRHVTPAHENPRLATAAQVRAIGAIANRRRLNLVRFLQTRVGVGKPADLTIKQASLVIDELKAAGAPNGD